MRPERGRGAAAELMAGGGGARPSLWRTPTPYLFLGFAFMMGLIAVALLVLICTRRKPSRRGDEERAAASSGRGLAPLDREAPKGVVIMAGDALPSFLASAKPLVVPAPRGAGAPEGGAAV
ncbi:protein GLUTAMINE DUMPER 4-like [Panicum miliaceum]|uniref:Protein GLUTAMINE DUMPER 4-like n=1 Tax=Panicum miliaceum TaxID=4540 RepID=A0A3L6RZM2_PANMI|nr:protein GLUTAMINE DUMPER 4-like [Panicum miliaceum]